MMGVKVLDRKVERIKKKEERGKIKVGSWMIGGSGMLREPQHDSGRV